MYSKTKILNGLVFTNIPSYFIYIVYTCITKTNIMKKRSLFILLMFSSLILSCNASDPEIPEEEVKVPEETETPDPKDPEEPNEPNDPDKELDWANANAVNDRLGRGINIGNTYEADASWQSPFVADDLKKIASLGFSHIRVPVKWERSDRGMSNAPYTINDDFMKTIQTVVDEALKNELHVIVNMHHHDNLFANPSAEKARFISQWEQISDYFKNYPDSLLFEILNEPHDKLTPALWNEYSKEALSVIRKTNPERCVLLGTAEWGGVGGLKSLEIPNDQNIIVTVHYYNPFEFTHQGASWSEGSEAWVGTQWHDTELERQAVVEDFKLALNLAKDKNIPIHVGEFGAFSRADIDSRVRWTRFLSRWFEQQGFSWAYWEWNSGFGIYDPNTKTFNQRLVNTLVKDEMPETFTPQYVLIYESNFVNSNDGWFLSNNDVSAQATLKVASSKATITVASPGTVDWHIQFIKTGIKVEKDKTYRLSFKASSPDIENRHLGVGMSKNSDPWTSYGSKSFTINKQEDEYNLIFNAAYTDNQARIVFNIGDAGKTAVVLSDIKLMEVKYEE